jgi:hypothetical protein
MTSSTSIFAKGLVLSFALHLSVDQMIDLVEIKNLDNWKRYLPIDLNLRQSQIFASVGTVLVLIMGLAM